jgi:pimeloyl-ACP methyl ester carboxylesterase
MAKRAFKIATVLLATLVLLTSGVGVAQQRSEAIVPFKIHVTDEVLRDLKERLTRVRFPDEIEGSGWDYGADLRYMKELVAYWRDKYDWRKHEAELNRFDQFTTNIDGLNIHFIHQRSPNPNATPLISLQGFPSSISEYVKVIGPLTDPAHYGGRSEDAFHFVTFSLPGIGFTEKPTRAGVSPDDAVIAAKLMARLGYTRYAVQGGDVGASIGRQVARDNASHVIGLHLNFCTAPPPPGDPLAGVSPEERKRMEERESFFEERTTGWLANQQRRPQTVGYALSDSPVGQAAWLIDIWRSSSDSGGNPEKQFTKDELLTNVMIYWVTGTSASSLRRYATRYRASRPVGLNVGRPAADSDTRRVEVPTACLVFPREAILSPRRWVEARVNLVRWTEMSRGGHFAPLEEPNTFVDDVRAFFRGLK